MHLINTSIYQKTNFGISLVLKNIKLTLNEKIHVKIHTIRQSATMLIVKLKYS